MIGSGRNVTLYTLNGECILSQNVCGAMGEEDAVCAVAFYEGEGNEWVEGELVFTGHRRGVVNVWRKCVASPYSSSSNRRESGASTRREGTRRESSGVGRRESVGVRRESGAAMGRAAGGGGSGKWILEHVKRLDASDRKGDGISSSAGGAAITAIVAMAQVVYAGDEDGRVVSALHFSPFQLPLSFLSILSFPFQLGTNQLTNEFLVPMGLCTA